MTPPSPSEIFQKNIHIWGDGRPLRAFQSESKKGRPLKYALIFLKHIAAPALGEVGLLVDLVHQLLLPGDQPAERCKKKASPFHCQWLNHLQQSTSYN